MTVLAIRTSALGTFPKGLKRSLQELEIGTRTETFNSTALLRSARIQRRVLDTWGNLLSLGIKWKDHQQTLVWKINFKFINNNNNDNNNTRGIWKLVDEWIPSKRQHNWRRPKYWEGSWRLEETCSHSNSSEGPSADTDVKNSKRVNNDNYNLDLAKKSKP